MESQPHSLCWGVFSLCAQTHRETEWPLASSGCVDRPRWVRLLEAHNFPTPGSVQGLEPQEIRNNYFAFSPEIWAGGNKGLHNFS